ncbi:MAG: glycoside hydrolase family 3 N-terminal domain-containing protein [Rectinemataceae bacterium]
MHRPLLRLGLASFAVFLAFAPLRAENAAPSASLRARAEALRAKLSLSDEAAQVLLVGIDGTGLPAATARELLSRTPLGGVLLFGFNLPRKARDLGLFTAAIQEAAAKNGSGLPFIIALDDEGGSVFRFHGSDITRLPAPLEAARRGPTFVGLLGTAAGRELRDLGVNVALAPVVEALTDDNRRFLGDRSYGRDPAKVDADAGAFIEGLQSAGVAAVAKHFPGNAGADPHQGLAFLSVDRKTYESLLLPRFAAAFGNVAADPDRGAAAVMLSHVIVPAIDPSNPASLSPRFVEGELRRSLGFRGVAMTDDLYMKALTERLPPERSAVQALLAGDDLLMLSVQDAALEIRDAIVRAVEAGVLSRSRLDEAADRVIELKLRFGMESALDPSVRERRLAGFDSVVAEDRRALSARDR